MNALKQLLVGAATAVVLAASVGLAAPANATGDGRSRNTSVSGSQDPLVVLEEQGFVGSATSEARILVEGMNKAGQAVGNSSLRPVSLTASAPGTDRSMVNGLEVNRTPGNVYGIITGPGKIGLDAGYIVINSPTAPSEYKFVVGDVDTQLVLNTDGSITVNSLSGEQLNYIQPAWARDSTGKELPTRYAVNGNVITQTVDHLGAQYPVVADPSFGCGVGWCSMYLSRSETNNIANFPASAAAIVAGACGSAPAPVAFVCGIAVAHIADMAVNAQKQNRCVGLVAYGVPPFVSWNAFIHGGEHCR